MLGRGSFVYTIIFAFGTDVRVLDFIHAGQARFLHECGTWVRIAGEDLLRFQGRIRLLGADPSLPRNESAIGTCLLGADPSQFRNGLARQGRAASVKPQATALPRGPKVWRTCHRNGGTASVGAGFSGETGHSIGYDDRVAGCDP